MGNVNCSGASWGKNKKDKRGMKSSKAADNSKGFKTLHVNIEHPSKSFEGDDLKSSSFTVPVPFGIARNSRCNVKVMNLESPVGGETEHAYEGEDEHDESMSMRRENSDSDFQAQPGYTKEDNSQQKDSYESFDINVNDQHEIKTKKDADEVIDRHRIISGHISDPGVGRAKFCASPKLKRSCSDLTRREMVRVADQLPLSKSQSFEEIQKLTKRLNGEILPENSGSPLSARTRCSADKVILKKHSSSQILPSRSRKIWWKLFLWSHRNLHGLGFAKAQPKPVLNQQGGYSSDTLEARKSMESSKSKSPRSFTEESPKTGDSINDNHSWDGFQGISSFWPQNQWVAFPAESSTFSRVDQWVKELPLEPLPEKNDDNEDGIAFPPSPDSGIPPARSSAHMSLQSNLNIPEEIVHANSVIQSLNSSSTVAHIAGTGLKVIPSISRFFSLRSVNLSGNFIVHITPGSLPKGLHVLNLSRNKINTIEGLRDLTRLRVLDLSYNRISRIGQGLSNCSLIKELYLAGNKISEVEGLHRLLKLTILDLSFNKITTTKALGQLVANYNSLLALNLLGNPIQSNISEDQLRKTACSLLPKLAFLNKQPINPQKAREVRSEAIIRAAMGDSSRSSRRKAMKRVSQGGSSSSSVHNSRVHVTQKSRHRSKSRTHHHSSLKKSSLPASSSH